LEGSGCGRGLIEVCLEETEEYNGKPVRIAVPDQDANRALPEKKLIELLGEKVGNET
jgi:hypothetical protein